jgi:hypothetical protein
MPKSSLVSPGTFSPLGVKNAEIGNYYSKKLIPNSVSKVLN